MTSQLRAIVVIIFVSCNCFQPELIRFRILLSPIACRIAISLGRPSIVLIDDIVDIVLLQPLAVM